ncbi:hypothetical protein GCM10010448_17010 [Streptomyces glomeratus]|uniref:Secreted protein n=1 Tax=Streptomyces glomeratus TaxID=284452 RepID=A0ABP6LBP9_9ACTN
MLLFGALRSGVRLARSASLVLHGYAHQVASVAQFTYDVLPGGVHDRVGDQLRHDESGRVASVLAHRPAGQPGACQLPGPCNGAGACGQLESETALGSRAWTQCCGTAAAEPVCGGVCS